MSMVDDVVDLRENLHIVLACTPKAPGFLDVRFQLVHAAFLSWTAPLNLCAASKSVEPLVHQSASDEVRCTA